MYNYYFVSFSSSGALPGAAKSIVRLLAVQLEHQQ